MEKDRYIKITKPDGRVSFAPEQTKAKLNLQNQLKQPNERFKLEVVEMTAKEVFDHPGIEAPLNAPATSNELTIAKKATESALSENEKLKARIAELEAIKAVAPLEVSSQLNAADVIAKMNEATTIAELEALIIDDTRVTVIKAAEKRKAELSAAPAQSNSGL